MELRSGTHSMTMYAAEGVDALGDTTQCFSAISISSSNALCRSVKPSANERPDTTPHQANWLMFDWNRQKIPVLGKLFGRSSPEDCWKDFPTPYQGQNFRLLAVACDQCLFAMVDQGNVIEFWMNYEEGEMQQICKRTLYRGCEITAITFSPNWAGTGLEKTSQLAVGFADGRMDVMDVTIIWQ
ncbi:uncharacterized protein LY89DRAFT_730089 [Mollisia scopiformis]|uniref:Uncharacterized protein n=1 Tax=Mollisia scopiformis TaxID=149040 RepID=A0A194XM34_MOLSC|nr:uncharacterized protein LY89DRAFT_730089 [Mollisia scopiformis]KUJ21305.1 hypothetical protein LY89DRAFT_730089 [Mollisia scopiformis]